MKYEGNMFTYVQVTGILLIFYKNLFANKIMSEPIIMEIQHVQYKEKVLIHL